MNVTSGKTRVLLITRNFPPLWGGMERLNWHLADELSKEFEVRVIGPAGASQHAPRGVIVREAPLRPLRRFLLSATELARREAKIWQPDIVLAGSGLTAPLVWLVARKCGALKAVYVHGLDLSVPHIAYRALWRPALRRMDCVIANSSATFALAQNIGIASECIHIIHPGVDMPELHATARARFRVAHGLGGQVPVLLSVGRLTARKGMREFVEDVLPRIVAERPDAQLVIVGAAPADALYAQAQSPASIEAAADAAGVREHVHFLGTRFGGELADAYAGADVHVFPVRELRNDPEGFGMVAVEAAAHGLSTVAYATGGVVDAVKEGVSGRLVVAGDAEGFSKAVLQIFKEGISAQDCQDFARQFEWPEFGRRISTVLSGLSR